MRSIRSTVRLRIPPSRVWALFHDMERHYLDWHPEHLGWEDLRGTATEEGSIVFADERVGRVRLRSRFFIDDVTPQRRIAFRVGFPFSLVHAGGSFELEPTPYGGCVVASEIHFGARSRFGAWVIDSILGWAGLPKALERHMHEEGDRLERLAAASGLGSAAAPAASRSVTARLRFFVARPAGEVFDYFADLRNEPQYNGQVRDIVKTSQGTIGLDTTFAGRHAGFGRVTWCLTEYDPPRRVTIDGVVGGGRYRWVADLEASGQGTTFAGRMQWEVPRWARPFRRFLELVLSWNARRSFRRFKSVLEGGPSSLAYHSTSPAIR